MPSTVSGLLLFVALMLPGFAYLVVKERAGTERRTSPFRETAAVVAASVASELVASLASAVLWIRFIDVKRLISSPGAYWRAEPLILALWGVGLLALATIIAAAAAWPWLRKHMPGSYPHSSTVSAWWMIFEEFDPTSVKHVGCELDDGSYIEGRLVSFNNNAEDAENRDLVLKEPIKLRPAGKMRETIPYGAHVVCVSARRIVTMFVTYSDPDNCDPPTFPGTEVAEEAAVADIEAHPSNPLASGPSVLP
ncbi:hypothetical protein SAMN05216266_113128 [Amycolatopsis marina]|uniref:Uncharacterized protein n=1 Tax=Amycolatopsis marina TaxID=490629 RepID=A0A1I1BFB2_9PSEU|nr:hypothetical protein SAMN05216266_113128 [Amycolatopsis marina]